MDPTANLDEQRTIAADILAVWDGCNADGTLTADQAEHIGNQAQRLADLVEALDEWICRDGFKPRQWDR